jgi:hypothetical protein
LVTKSRRMWPWIVTGVALLVVVIGVVHRATSRATVTVIEPPAHAPAAPPLGLVARRPAPPTGPLTSFGDGTYQVGTAPGDVAAGSYRSTGSTEGMSCYWARTKDPTGNVDTIIADGYPSGPTTITIKDSDGAFLASGCAPWNKVG